MFPFELPNNLCTNKKSLADLLMTASCWADETFLRPLTDLTHKKNGSMTD